MAAKVGITSKCVGLTKVVAEGLSLCRSNLLHIEEGLPTPYFPKTDDLLEVVTRLWPPMNASLPMKTDSESVLGEFFESQLPNVTSRAPLTLLVKKLHGGFQARKFVLEECEVEPTYC